MSGVLGMPGVPPGASSWHAWLEQNATAAASS
jgi:hypothetical protein